MQNRDQLYIDGRWTAPAGTKTIAVVSPSTEEIIARVPEGTPQDVDAAVSAARAAFDGWAATAPAERAGFLSKIHEGLKARADEIGRTIASEVGMPLKLATRIQAGSPIYTFAMYARMLADFPFEARVGNSLVLREPITGPANWRATRNIHAGSFSSTVGCMAYRSVTEEYSRTDTRPWPTFPSWHGRERFSG